MAQGFTYLASSKLLGVPSSVPDSDEGFQLSVNLCKDSIVRRVKVVTRVKVVRREIEGKY